MADLPKVEAQNSGQVLKDRKVAIAAARKELEAAKAVVQQLMEIRKQNQFYEREIDGARGRIFMLLVAQTRNAEVACAEEYVAQISAALEVLTEQEKKAKQE